MDQARLKWLFNRYIDKVATPAEREELMQLMEQEENEEAVKELLDHVWTAFHPQQPPFEPATGAAILKNVLETDRSRFRLPVWQLVAAAAVLICVCLTAGFFLYRSKTIAPATNALVQQKDSIVPGSNRAVLTLADGSGITLDSAGNQVIRQGDVVIRQKNGQLDYTAQGSGAANSFNTLTTPRGGQFQLVLPDGTKVWLNSASRLTYPTAFTGKERSVQLEGQGYFEIAKDAAHPFKVRVKEMEVQVLGTGFDLMAYPDESTVNTTLLEGAVNVINGKESKLLAPGQQAVLNNIKNTITVKKVNVNRVIAWKSRLFVFNNADLGTILREIARWYDVEIINEVGDNDELYGGSISRQQSLTEVLDLLASDGSIHFKIEERTIRVSR